VNHAYGLEDIYHIVHFEIINFVTETAGTENKINVSSSPK
jgi:hypothetical protein